MENYFINLLINRELHNKILIGLLGALILKFIVWLFTQIRNLIFAHKQFTVSGTWSSSFDSPYLKQKHIIELVKIKQKQEKISLYIEHYSDSSKEVLKYLGFGMNKTSEISAIYYAHDNTRIQNGVILLQVKHFPLEHQSTLVGNYAEFDRSNSKINIVINYNEYKLQRIYLSVFKRIKLDLHIQCFKDYNDIKNYIYNKGCTS